MTEIDIDRIRAETPGVANVAHFNNAGASLMPQAVLDATIQFLELESRIGGYEAAEHEADKLEFTYTAAAEMLGAARRNLAVVESASRAWNAAFAAIRFKPGDRILTTRSEYVSNMGGLLYAKDRFGVEVVLVPSDETGQVDVAALANLLDDRTKVVSLTHIPTQGGLVNPAAEIGSVLKDSDALYLLDACQSVGQMPIDVEKIGCDILSFTGRKFVRGPRGTGMLWVGDTAIEHMSAPPGMDGGGGTWSDDFTFEPLPDAGRFEMFEMTVAAKVGLGVALQYANEIGLEAIAERNAVLAARLRMELDQIPGVTVRDLGVHKCAIVTFDVAGVDCTAVKMALRKQAINVSVSGVTSARLDFGNRGLTELVRASLHYYNTDDEIDQLVSAIARLERP